MSRPQITGYREIPVEDVESNMRESLPPILYKYRPWVEAHHKAALIDAQIWFSSPKSLNDLYDIRLAYTFNSAEAYSSEFFEKLKAQFPGMTRLIPGTRDYQVALENQYDEIKSDPQKWFYDNLRFVREGKVYDEVGVFSTTIDPINILMWGYYGDSNKGYIIGYDPFLVWKAKMSIYGITHYLDEPIPYSFLNDEEKFGFIDLFIKKKDWDHEQEYRFITFVENDKERLVSVSRSAIKEVILGKNILKEAEQEIINTLKESYNSAVRLYKIQEGIGFKLELIEIQY